MKPMLLEAARWRLIGMLFQRPGTAWHDELRALAAELDHDELNRAVAEARGADEGAYLQVLGPGGRVSPREVAYRPMGDPGRLLAELSGLYEAFAYRPRAEDPVDHVAVEAGFAGYLALKQAYAVARADVATASRVDELRREFIGEHLACFAGELRRRLQTTGPSYLARVARVLGETCPEPRRSPAGPPHERAEDPLCDGCAGSTGRVAGPVFRS